MGIYAIRCAASGKIYVGSALNIRTRWNGHRHRLEKGCHHSPKLQNAWRRYGPETFTFEVLEAVSDAAALISREQHWLDITGAATSGFNICPVAGRTAGRAASEQTKAKMREARRHVSAETRAKRSASLKGREISLDHRDKIGAANRGRKASPEAREKMRLAALNRSPAVRRKIAEARSGYRPTEETKAKIAAALTGIKRSAETRAKVGAASRGRTWKKALA